jgi:protein O-GlcNAc transferase
VITVGSTAHLSENDGHRMVRSILRKAQALLKHQQLAKAKILYRRAYEYYVEQHDVRVAQSVSLVAFRLAVIHERNYQDREAAEYYRFVTTVPSDSRFWKDLRFAAFINLGNILFRESALRDAWQCYEAALAIYPRAGVYLNLGQLFIRIGWHDDAIAAANHALDLDPSYAPAKVIRIVAHLLMVYADEEELNSRRERYAADLKAFADEVSASGPEKRGCLAEALTVSLPFYLPYQGRNDRNLQQVYGRLVCQVMAARCPQFSKPLAVRPHRASKRVRIGIVSAHLLSDHSVWKIPTRGWVENIDKSRFELFGYSTDHDRRIADDLASAHFAHFRQGPRGLAAWCQTIAADQLDALLFVEFGMDDLSLLLGAVRLAPIQLTSWAHPVTSGMPTIDYFLSSALMEPERGDEHYTEALVRLPNLSFHYTPQHAAPERISKHNLGVAEDEVLFWCCQSIFKYLPQHDDVFPRIAQKVGRCKFLFNPREKNPPSVVFKERIARSFARFGINSEDFCLFPYNISHAEFTGICAIADVYLDSIGWSGCNTTFDAIAFDLPIVTLSGEMMRSRHTTAILRMMGMEEMIALGKDEYVDIVTRLAVHPDERHRIATLMRENKWKLYEDLTPVRALEDFLWSTVHHNGFGTSSIEPCC